MTFYLSAAKIYKNGVVMDNMECVIENYLSILLGGTNMKKILFGLLVVALLLCVTACSEDQYAKLGELMGKMSGNVYGIKPNMQDVEAATGKVDDAVKVDGDTVKVEISDDGAKAIVDSVIAVQDSVSKTEALQESLSEPLVKDPDKQEAVRDGILVVADSSVIDDETVATYDPERKQLAEAVNQALDAAVAGISYNPTKGELATVAVLKTLSDAVKAGEGYADAGKAAVDALKITTEVGKVDVLADADLSAIVGNLTGKGISRANDEPGAKDYMPMISKSVASIVKCFTKDEKFDGQRYDKFILECKAIKASYEMIAKGYTIDFEARLDKQKLPDGGKGLTIEELGRYLVATVFTELDRISKASDKAPADALKNFAGTYVGGNYDKLINLADNYDKLEDPTDDESPSKPALMNAVVALALGIGDDPSATGYDLNKLLEDMGKALKDSSKLLPTTISVLQVTGVILLDSEYTDLLSLDKSMDGTLAGLLKKISE